MPYIGKQLSNGNYLKLDDISSSFNGSTTTFSLTNGGSAYYPGSEFSILVSVGGVIQEPESAYQISNDEITFANAPTAQDSFFCVVLGDAIGINVPGNNTVNGAQMAKPFNYDGGLLYLDDSNNKVGINSTSPSVALDVVGDLKVTGNITGIGGTLGGTLIGNVYSSSGISTFNDLRVTNNLTVEGTTTTLDTNLIGVDRVEVGANSNTVVGVAITQSGTADILQLFDGTSKVVTVDDEGKVGINSTSPSEHLDVVGNIDIKGGANQLRITSTAPAVKFTDSDAPTGFGMVGVNNTSGSLVLRSDDGDALSSSYMGFEVDGGEKLRIDSNGDLNIGNNPTNQYGYKLNIQDSAILYAQTASSGGTELKLYLDHSNTIANFGTVSTSHLAFVTANTEKVRITSDGKVGINRTTPAAPITARRTDAGGAGTSGVIAEFANSSGYGVWFGQSSASGASWGATTGDFYWCTGGLSSQVERLRITSTGKVGINTTTISSTLQIYGANDGEGTATGQITLKDTAAYNATPTGGIVFQGHHTAGAQAIFAGIRGFKANSGDGDYDGCLGFDVRKHGAVAYEAMRINEDGEVGIGTDNPRRLLHLNGGSETVKIQITNAGTGSVNDGDGFQLGVASDGTAVIEQRENKGLNFATNNNERFRIDNTGRLIAGGTSAGPYHQDGDNLNLYSGGNTGMSIFSGNSSLGSLFFADDNNDVHGQRRGAIQYNHNGNSLAFWTNASERFRITSTGQVGIGTDTAETGYILSMHGDLSLGEKSGTDNTYIDQKQDGDLHLINSGRTSNGGSGSGGAGGVGVNKFNNIAGGTSLFRDFCVFNGKNSKVLVVDGSTSRVGVGIDAPTKLLDLATSASADGIRIKSTGSTYNDITLDANRSAKDTHIGRIISHWDGTAVSYISFDTGDAAASGKNKGYMRFWTADGSGNFERLRIDSSGRFLIAKGTASTTTSQIQIGDPGAGYTWAVADVPQVLIAGVNNESPAPGTLNIALRVADENNNNMFQIHNRGGGNNDVGQVYVAGKLGIGLNNPEGKIHAYSTERYVQELEAQSGITAGTTSGTIYKQQYTTTAGSSRRMGFFGIKRTHGSGDQRANFVMELCPDNSTNVNLASPNANTTAFEFKPSGQIWVKNGGGIDFSADGNAGGMTHEILDDYEEGLFTPQVLINGDTAGVTQPGTRKGSYEKVGNVVHFRVWINGTISYTGTSSHSLRIDGLPFTHQGNTDYYGAVASWIYSGFSEEWKIISRHSLGSARITMQRNDAEVVYSEVSGNTNFMFSGSYRAA